MYYKSEFLTNYTDKNFLNKIRESLRNCDRFLFSVSFIKIAGLKLIMNELEDALASGASGKLITSTYQNFTDIPSLEKFLELSKRYPDFSCKIDYKSFFDVGFHSKGYIFEYSDCYEVIIGSSNITRYALEKNIEWNISLYSKEHEDIYKSIIDEFNCLWGKTDILTKDIIIEYTKQLEYVTDKWDMDFEPSVQAISPNYMQRKALKELRRYRDMGVNKALVIASTGSGKTYLAAFDAKIFDAKRLLFVVHRDTIINDAVNTFRKVFGKDYTYGKYVGEFRELDKDFIFASNILLSRNLMLFDKNEFDYIIIDEVHHAVAETYQNIIEYFKPQFLLGLTATPERMDNESVFEIFEKNVPYELRLRDALMNDLVVPFKYYGIKDDTDFSGNNVRQLVKELSRSVRSSFIADQIEKTGFSGDKLKAIGFCRNVEHAKLMSDNMNLLGIPSTYLTGRNNTRERIDTFYKLQDDKNPLNIIFTVDIMNEGVDLPQVNMVLFLRPTESSTIFIQQLGRGLRKYGDKKYLTVLDFIGNNYKRNVQIALALGTLSQDLYIDKPYLRESIENDFRNLDLPGVEIKIDEKSKEEILKQIESTNFNSLVFLEQDYRNFKAFLNGNVPKHMDYINIDSSPDLLRFIKTQGSYYEFLLKAEPDFPAFNEQELNFIKYLSSFLPLIRPDEFMIIKYLIDNKNKTFQDLINDLKDDINHFSLRSFEHAFNHLQNKFYSLKEQEIKTQYLIINHNQCELNISFSNEIFKDFAFDLLDYGLTRYEKEFNGFDGNLKLHAHYSRNQFLLATCSNTMTFREGIKYYEDELYLFIDLNKDADKEEWLLYNDKFITPSLLQWESSTSTTMTNKTGLSLIEKRFCHLLVRKIKMEDGIYLPYIYIGKGELTNPRPSSNIKQSLLFDILLQSPIPDYLKFDFGLSQK